MNYQSKFRSIRKLSTIRTTIKALTIVCSIAMLFAFGALLLYTGTMDFASESHTPLTAEQERTSLICLIGGIVTLVLTAFLSYLCERVSTCIDKEVERRRAAIRKQRDRLSAQQENTYKMLRNFFAANYPDEMGQTKR